MTINSDWLIGATMIVLTVAFATLAIAINYGDFLPW